jgi:hypothetical protein
VKKKKDARLPGTGRRLAGPMAVVRRVEVVIVHLWSTTHPVWTLDTWGVVSVLHR